MPEYIDTNEAAQIMGVSVETVRTLCANGILDGAIQERKNSPWQIPKHAVNLWVEQNNKGYTKSSENQYNRNFSFLHNLSMKTVVGILIGILGVIGTVVATSADWREAVEQLYSWGIVQPIKPASNEEMLIIIATFYSSEGIANTEPYNEIKMAIQQTSKQLTLSNLRVEVSPIVIRAEAIEEAKRLGKKYNAAAIIWGADTGVRVTVNFINLLQPNSLASNSGINEIERTQLANPSSYAKFITEELPSQMAFLSLFAIGQLYEHKGNYTQAIELISKGVNSNNFSQQPIHGLAEAYYRLGWLYQLAVKDHDASLAAYDKAIELKPDFSEVYFNRARLKATDNDLEAALQDVEQAISINSQFAKAYNLRGLIRLVLNGETSAALQDISLALKLEPDCAICYANRANIQWLLKNSAAAFDDIQAALQMLDLPDFYVVRAKLLESSNKFDDALQEIDKALAINENLATAYFRKSSVLTSQGKFDEAVTNLDKAIEIVLKSNYSAFIDIEIDRVSLITPNSFLALCYSTRARLIFQKLDLANVNDNLVKAALKDFNLAIEINPKDFYAYAFRGEVYSLLRTSEKAMSDFSTALELVQNDKNPINRIENEAQVRVFMGNMSFHQGRYEEAIEEYSRALQLNSKIGEAYGNRGLSYAVIHRNDEALADMNKAIELFPFDAQGFSNRGQFWQGVGEYRKAIADFEMAVKIYPGYINAHMEIALALYQLGDFEEALHRYTQVITLSPDDSSAYLSRGHVYVALSRFENALSDYNKTIELDPENGLAYANRGFVFSSLAQNDITNCDSAILDFSKAIELDPQYINNTHIYMYRGNCFRLLGHYDDAIRDFNRGIELDPKAFSILTYRGLAYFALGSLDSVNYQSAIEDFDKAIVLAPKESEIYNYRGYVYGTIENYEMAQKDFDTAIELKPDFAEAYFNRGLINAARNDYQKAITDYSQAIIYNHPQLANVYFQRGNVHVALNDPINSWKADYEHAIELDPEFADIYNAMCWAYALEQKASIALPYCQKAVELIPNPIFLDSRGLVYALLDDFQSAISDFQQYIDWATQQPANRSLEVSITKRKQWIDNLHKGINPITQEVLSNLRSE